MMPGVFEAYLVGVVVSGYCVWRIVRAYNNQTADKEAEAEVFFGPGVDR